MKNVILSVFGLIILIACDSKKATTESNNSPKSLNGSWELNYITFTRLPVNELYANKKPVINFNIAEQKVNGNNGCNSFTGMVLSVTPGQIMFDENFAATKMFCEGQGEAVFTEAFKKTKGFFFSDGGNTLHLTDGDIDVMRLTKK